MSQSPQAIADELRSECHRLIEQIARQPYCIKRLLAARESLAATANYKRHRRNTSASLSNPAAPAVTAADLLRG